MDILREATDWARSEVFSSTFFILFALIFLIGSAGFWYLGKTEISRAYVIPMLVTGSLLLIVGGGLSIGNKLRITQFEKAYRADAKTFVDSELERAEKTMNEYRTIVFKAVPLIIIICSLLIVFIDKPIWRASSISAIAMLVVILLVDGTAKGRIEDYNEKLQTFKSQNFPNDKDLPSRI